jgi:hypothetical protein
MARKTMGRVWGGIYNGFGRRFFQKRREHMQRNPLLRSNFDSVDKTPDVCTWHILFPWRCGRADDIPNKGTKKAREIIHTRELDEIYGMIGSLLVFVQAPPPKN